MAFLSQYFRISRAIGLLQTILVKLLTAASNLSLLLRNSTVDTPWSALRHVSGQMAL
jgi:hypothetical protein